MLTIKDLTLDKELDTKAMAEVRGGSSFDFNGPVTFNGGNNQLGDGNTQNIGYVPPSYPSYPPCHVPYGQAKKYA
jgi:hypothetical protein